MFGTVYILFLGISYKIVFILFVLCNSISVQCRKRAENETETEAPKVVKEKTLQDYDWDVWCKFQPNGHNCNENGIISPRFYYDIKLEDCKTFDFRGCSLSFNNFETLSECHTQCRESGQHLVKANVTDKVFCRFQPDFGKCNDYHPLWYYDVSHGSCRGFSYSGCGGNKNRFSSAQLCNAICIAAVENT